MKAKAAMDPHEKKLLQILNALHPANQTSQRDLSNSLKISLGAINASIRWMLDHDFIQKKIVNGSRLSYRLTSSGFNERRRLNLLRWGTAIECYASMCSEIESVLHALARRKIQKVAFLGAGRLAEIAYIGLLKTEIQLTAVVDDNDIGGRFFDYRIASTANLPTIHCDKILVTGMDVYLQKSALEDITAKYKEKIVLIHTD